MLVWITLPTLAAKTLLSPISCMTQVLTSSVYFPWSSFNCFIRWGWATSSSRCLILSLVSVDAQLLLPLSFQNFSECFCYLLPGAHFFLSLSLTLADLCAFHPADAQWQIYLLSRCWHSVQTWGADLGLLCKLLFLYLKGNHCQLQIFSCFSEGLI